MAEILLEANQRGIWQEVSNEMLDNLKNIVNEAEGEIEGIIVIPNRNRMYSMGRGERPFAPTNYNSQPISTR